MLVVSDTSALSNLATIGRLDLLRLQFGVVLMPGAVARELDALRDPSAREALSTAVNNKWLLEQPLPLAAPFPAELQGLDAGETEALRLALSLSADCVLMDEKEGRQRAAGRMELGARGDCLLGSHKATTTRRDPGTEANQGESGCGFRRRFGRAFTLVYSHTPQGTVLA